MTMVCMIALCFGKKKIAQDLIGWMVDTHETLYDFVDTDEERSTDNETIYSGVFI